MKFFGYEKGNDKLLELEEVSFQCDLNELEDIIKFLNEVKVEHASVRNETNMCHSHFKDWKSTWIESEPDLIIVTKFNN